MKKVERNYRKLIVMDALINIVHSINIIIIGDSNDWGLIPFVMWDLVLGLIYMIIHGVVIYCAYRQVFRPHFVTGIIILISTILLLFCPYGDKSWILGSSIFMCGFFVISIIFSFITMIVCKSKRNRREGRQIMKDSGTVSVK